MQNTSPQEVKRTLTDKLSSYIGVYYIRHYYRPMFAMEHYFKSMRQYSHGYTKCKATLFFFFWFMLVYIMVYHAKIVYKFSHTNMLPEALNAKEEMNTLPIVRSESLQCKDLINTAKQMLEGVRMPFPFESEAVRWKFRTRATKVNAMYGDNLTEQPSEIVKVRNKYNVTSKKVSQNSFMFTYGHGCCYCSRRRATLKAKTVGGFDYVSSFDLDAISKGFQKTHNDIISSHRGAGYWIWKPYLLLKMLTLHMKQGDIIMYQDAGAYFIINYETCGTIQFFYKVT